MKYDYKENIKADIVDYIKENDLQGKDFEDLYDNMFVNDYITGNASGSYYCNAYKAEEAICHNLDLLQDALDEFGYDNVRSEIGNAEWCDVTIRCYLLAECLQEVLEESVE